MKDFFKNNYTILTIILIIGVLLRLLEIKHPVGYWDNEYIASSFSAFNFHFDFFDCIKSNNYAPLHFYYLKLWNAIFKNLPQLLPCSSLFATILGTWVMYLTGLNYSTKEGHNKIALTNASIASISVFLICFAQEAKTYSLTFLLCALILLFSIKTYENPTKKNISWLGVFSLLLILEHTIGIIYVIFNIFGLLAFKNKPKGKKKEKDYLIPIVAALVLFLPMVPFLFRIFAKPTFVTQWWAPFDWSRIFFSFTDFFSPVLKNVTTMPVDFYSQIVKNGNFNFGFILFALLPAIIAFVMIIKSNIEAKRINKYLLSVSLAVFLTVLISSVTGKISFLTKYIVEIYPILILMASVGLKELNSNNLRITLATVYVFMNIFCFIAARLGLGLV